MFVKGSLIKQRFFISVKIWNHHLTGTTKKKRWLFGVHTRKSERASLSPTGCKNLVVHEIDCASLPIHVANLPGVSAGFPRLYDWMFPSLVSHVTGWDVVRAATAMNTLDPEWSFFMVVNPMVEAVKTSP